MAPRQSSTTRTTCRRELSEVAPDTRTQRRGAGRVARLRMVSGLLIYGLLGSTGLHPILTGSRERARRGVGALAPAPAARVTLVV